MIQTGKRDDQTSFIWLRARPWVHAAGTRWATMVTRFTLDPMSREAEAFSEERCA